jgi:MFS family permease
LAVDAPPATHRPTIVAMSVAIALFTVTTGMSFPLLSLVLERRGASEAAIGVNGALLAAGTVVATLCLPWLLRWVSPIKVMAASLVGCAVFIPALSVSEDIATWHVLRFLLGLNMAAPFILSEALVNAAAGGARRGRVVATFGAISALGMSVGPVLLTGIGTVGPAPVAVCVGAALLAVLPLVLLARQRSAPHLPPPSVRGVVTFVAWAPVIAAAVALYAAYDALVLVLLPVYALSKGFTGDLGSLAVGVFMAGAIAMQPLIGWLSDRLTAARTVSLCLALSAGLCALLPWCWALPPLLWAVLFLLGGSHFGVYTAALTQLGHRFQGSALVSGAAAFGLLYGLGSVAGPFAAGPIMGTLGGDTVQWLMAAAFLAPLLTGAVQAGGRALSGRGPDAI